LAPGVISWRPREASPTNYCYYYRHHTIVDADIFIISLIVFTRHYADATCHYIAYMPVQSRLFRHAIIAAAWCRSFRQMSKDAVRRSAARFARRPPLILHASPAVAMPLIARVFN